MLVEIARGAKGVREKEERIAGFQLQREFVVCRRRKETRRQARNLKEPAFLPAKQKRARHSSTDNPDPRTGRIEQGILNGRVAPWNAAKQQPLVQQGKNALGFHACFVDAAKCPNGERGIKRRRKALAGNAADIEDN